MPTPACQVKDGAGSFGPTTYGVDVTPTNTITIDLIDKACDSWTIECLTTDELSDASAVNTELASTINPTTRQATFTAPAAGRAYRFESVVNQGIGQDGTRQSTYRTTFAVYTLTGGGNRVIAADEETEGHPVFGYLGTLNNLIRNPSGYTPPAPAAVSALDIDWTEADIFYKDLSAGANAITFSNAGSGRYVITVRLTGNVGSSTVTWPAGVQWAGGAEPTQSPTGTDVYTFVHDGTTIFGSVVQDFS